MDAVEFANNWQTHINETWVSKKGKEAITINNYLNTVGVVVGIDEKGRKVALPLKVLLNKFKLKSN